MKHTSTHQPIPGQHGLAPQASRTDAVTDLDEIVSSLRMLRNHAAPLELRISGANGACTGSLFELGRAHFLLRDIRPAAQAAHLQPGARLAFAAHLDGVFIRGDDCPVVGMETAGGLPCYRIGLPRQLLRHQRRRHARLSVPLRVSPHDGVIHMVRAAAEPINGRILDISLGGCRAVFSGTPVPPLASNEALQACELRVTPTLRLTAGGVVRHNSWDDQRRITTVGVEFAGIALNDLRRLENYVQQLTASVRTR